MGGWVSVVPGTFGGGVDMYRGKGMCRGLVLTPPTWDREVGTHSPILTPSGSHHTYDQLAGSTHPTGMLSC